MLAKVNDAVTTTSIVYEDAAGKRRTSDNGSNPTYILHRIDASNLKVINLKDLLLIQDNCILLSIPLIHAQFS